MKNLFFVCFIILFQIVNSFAQQNRIASLYEKGSQKNILWENVIVEDLPGKGKSSLLTFRKAQYDFDNHFFPIYTERYSLPLNSFAAEIKIYDAVFQPLNDAEKLALNSYDARAKNYISDEITAAAAVSTYKKQPYAYVQFIPVRKNKTTGNYEKLIS